VSVIMEALAALADGLPRLLAFGVSDENAFAVGLACGGTIRILVLPVGDRGLPPVLLAEITKAHAARQPIAHWINLTDWSQSLEGPEAQADRFRADQSGVEDQDFIHIHDPPLRMAEVTRALRLGGSG
jgi:xanthine dehydrogenase accessory factor